ncbi:MAG: hypothetical protein PSX36_07735 [bacterium]|nr:hypothetical protein [bacterium]
MFVRFLLLVFILFSSYFGEAQRIKNLKLYLANSTVSIKFTLSAGTSCNGFKVLRSLDSLFYNEIYDYSGICGASGLDEEKSAIDASPAMNQVNYYKIQLSTFETSDAKGIYVSSTSKANMIVFPNPVSNDYDPVQLKLIGADNSSVSGYLYDEFGKVNATLNLYTTASVTSINAGALRNGIYLIWLTDGLERYSAKMIILR